MYVVRESVGGFSPQKIWQALSDPTRRRLLDRLAGGPRTTSELCEGIALTRFGVMKHIGVLEEAGLVIARRQGRLRYNHLNAAPLRALQSRWLSPQAERAAAMAQGIERIATETDMTEETPDNDKAPSKANVAEVALEWTIQAPVQKVWRTMVEQVEDWWPREHRVAESGAKFKFDAALGGSLQELHENGGGVVWFRVYALTPLRSVDLTGDLASRYGGPATSLIHIELSASPIEGATIFKMTDSVFGRVGPQFRESLAAGWQAIIGDGLIPFAEAP